MATITASDVNQLRRQTGAGMMDCRKALVESDGDFEKAVDYLRKKGQKVAALRSDRETKEGVVIARTADDARSGAVVCLSCETDFVAKNEDFVRFGEALAALALQPDLGSLEALSAATLDGTPVADRINDLVAKIGEKISLSRFEKIEAPYVASYIHGNFRMGVLVGFSKPISEEAAKDIAMQIAAMNPLAVNEEHVTADVLARDKEIAVEQVKAEGKPAEMAERIAQGKLNKFFKENTLLAQAFVKDNARSVADYLTSVDKEVSVTAFRRVVLG